MSFTHFFGFHVITYSYLGRTWYLQVDSMSSESNIANMGTVLLDSLWPRQHESQEEDRRAEKQNSDRFSASPRSSGDENERSGVVHNGLNLPHSNLNNVTVTGDVASGGVAPVVNEQRENSIAPAVVKDSASEPDFGKRSGALKVDNLSTVSSSTAHDHAVFSSGERVWRTVSTPYTTQQEDEDREKARRFWKDYVPDIMKVLWRSHLRPFLF